MTEAFMDEALRLVDRPAPEGFACCWGRGDVKPPWGEDAQPCAERAVRAVGLTRESTSDAFVDAALSAVADFVMAEHLFGLCEGHSDEAVAELDVLDGVTLPPEGADGEEGVAPDPEAHRRKVAQIQREQRKLLPPPPRRRLIRVGAELTQSEVAERVGVTGGTISRWEEGKIDPPEPERSVYADVLHELQRISGV